MALRQKKPTLAEKISSLVTAAPTVFGSDDENEETKAKVVEHYDETESEEDAGVSSTFRKRNVDLLDEIDKRYKGKKVSRKDIYESEDDSVGSEIDNDESENSNDESSKDTKSEEEEMDEEESDSGSEGFESDGADDSEIDEDNPLRRDRVGEANFKEIIPTNVRAEVAKGNCVREQLKIWENLLEMRIKLQKCLITSNKMPQHDVHAQLRSNNRFKKDVNDGTTKLSSLLDNLLELQNNLLGNYPETKTLKTGEKRKADEIAEAEDMDEEICSDTEDEMGEENTNENSSDGGNEVEETVPQQKKKKKSLEEYEKLIAQNHRIYRDYRNSVIQKWNDKTRVASGNLNKSSSQAIVKQIDFVLGDKAKLVKRTQLKRSEYDILGKEFPHDEDGRRTQEYDSEIYDDDDFYHQLLRELIEYKSSDVTDPVQLSKQWIALQNMRSKMKRKIDTRATKGRRLRYDVHSKLVNFMAPINSNDNWSDLAKNELYNSLFGKIKSTDIETTVSKESDM
ncbi:protein AATF [Venturia canescens]|uniref:protein AATF n=1 Tax=Venturia canescens TaxID=32260 RepID=UPI001C9D3DD6|nr:protein AATF [Venturia canescens]